MLIKPSELSDHTFPVFYYIRAQKPQEAAMMAARQWLSWEKKDLGLEFHKFPDIEEAGAGCGIDERDFQEKWKAAQASGDFKYVGMRENPTLFTYGLRTRDAEEKSKIIVPINFK